MKKNNYILLSSVNSARYGEHSYITYSSPSKTSPMWVNIDKIEKIYADERGLTRIELNNRACVVKESIEEIFELMEK